MPSLGPVRIWPDLFSPASEVVVDLRSCTATPDHGFCLYHDVVLTHRRYAPPLRLYMAPVSTLYHHDTITLRTTQLEGAEVGMETCMLTLKQGTIEMTWEPSRARAD
jgi:hypothetical protein